MRRRCRWNRLGLVGRTGAVTDSCLLVVPRASKGHPHAYPRSQRAVDTVNGLGQTHPEIIGSIAVLGALVLSAARQLIALRIHQSQTHWPGFGVTLVGIVFVATRVVHLSDASAATSLVMIRVQYGVTFLLPGLGMAAVDLMCTDQISITARRAMAAGLALGAIGVGSPWIVDGPVEPHLDLFGHEHLGAQPGWLTFIVIPVVSVATFLAIRKRLTTIPRELRTQRRAFLIGVVFFVVAAVNDSLTGSGALSSIFLLDYAFLAFGLLSAKYELRVTAVSLEQLAFRLEAKRSVLERRERSLARTLRNLEASNERYRHLAAVTGEGVVLCSGSRVLDVNDAACRILGHGEQLDPRQLRAQDFSRFVARDHHEQVAALLDASEGPYEFALIRPDGSTVQVSVKAVGAPPDSRGTRVLLVHDISLERELQRRLATADRLAAIGTLAAGTAHEINNPLTFVLASAELLGEELSTLELPAEVGANLTGSVDDLMTGALRIRDVVRNLMSLARDRGGEETVVDVRPTLKHCIAMAAPQARHRARVVTDFEEMRPVLANEGRLFQVFLNLIVNAAHAIPEGEVDKHQIRVRGRTEGEWTIVEVSDTGAGIDPAMLDKIFEPFFTTKQNGQGTGLGLPISQGIVSDLGGRIEVASTLGVGTTFRVFLPATDATPASKSQPQPVVANAKLRILVIDDEVILARSLARMLDRHEVDVVNSGREALERFAAQSYDVAICDVMMPDITGIQLFQRLREANNPITDRFLFVTGGVSSTESQRFLDELGSKRWLPKPIPMPELRARVAKLGEAIQVTDRRSGPGPTAGRVADP